MRMGINHWEWEGTGLKKTFPHTSNTQPSYLFCLFLLIPLPTDTSAGYFSLATSTIYLTLKHSMQNDISLRSDIFIRKSGLILNNKAFESDIQRLAANAATQVRTSQTAVTLTHCSDAGGCVPNREPRCSVLLRKQTVCAVLS